MIEPETSRRIGKLMTMPAILYLPRAELMAFKSAVQSIETFDELPEKWKAVIRQAEDQRASLA